MAETKAAASAASQVPAAAQASTSIEADWNPLGMDLDMDMDLNIDYDDPTLLDPEFNIPATAFGLQDAALPLVNDFSSSQELLGLGLDEPLPPQVMINELYFSHDPPSSKLLNHQVSNILRYVSPHNAVDAQISLLCVVRQGTTGEAANMFALCHVGNGLHSVR